MKMRYLECKVLCDDGKERDIKFALGEEDPDHFSIYFGRDFMEDLLYMIQSGKYVKLVNTELAP